MFVGAATETEWRLIDGQTDKQTLLGLLAFSDFKKGTLGMAVIHRQEGTSET